jgi:hypothetical protein
MSDLTKTISCAAFAVLLVFASGCRKSESPATGEVPPLQAGGPPPAPVEPPTGSALPAPGTPAVAASSVALPATFPKDVPLYPGAIVAAGSSDQSASGAGHSVTLLTADPPVKVADWYEVELPKQGWAKSLAVAVPDGKGTFFTKDNRTLTLKASPDPLAPTKTSCSILVSEDRTTGGAR